LTRHFPRRFASRIRRARAHFFANHPTDGRDDYRGRLAGAFIGDQCLGSGGAASAGAAVVSKSAVS
jgi:hypothetical protein